MEIRKALSNEKGLTLIEVLSSIAILVIVLGIGMAALAQSSTLTNEIRGESQERQDMQVGLLELTKAVQEAKDIKKGTDEYNFEITNTDNSISNYWLVDGQLNSDVKSGQTPVEGVRKVTIVDKKGITLEIDDLEEPVVLAQRGGGVIETGLGAPDEEENWEDRKPDVVCMKNEKIDFSGYKQFEEIAKRQHWGKDSIRCDNTSGTLTIWNEVPVNLTNGDITIYANNIVLNYQASFSLSNGSVYLPKTEILSIENHGTFVVENGGLYVNEQINLHNSSTLYVGGKTVVNKDFNSTNVGNKFTSKGDFIVLGNASIYQAQMIDIEKTFYIRGNLTVNYSASNKINIGDKLIVGGNVDLHQRFTFNGKNGIWVNGNFTAKNELDISTESIISIRGNVTFLYRGKMSSNSSIHIGGKLDLAREATVTSGGNLYIEKGIKLSPKSMLIVKGESYINERITFPEIKSESEKYAFNTYGNITYTGPVEGTINFPSNSSMFNAASEELIPKVNTMVYFPDFPPVPN
ncbi:prepilin-type N-terminal cleavage/methylation domain-containing protein [Alkalicoccobacillus plakortidis]|uniref:Prepilin-type N-terminal cleavage/methylation domain-containing protein n=1 Tax=Alkalicoccobacillus plakortidis TaxID=444060 RepID=A0ABT0XGZ0_9BACI|nr:prepilin-type N-terminal cleavage/methylation domain-containing protein [Alkalicoccobacillus plakortidis]MCM2675186.1 prepilin-type N-terminal cleavage/methylation domain-containing protein [Alkalicoccobacillus plakortidis]